MVWAVLVTCGLAIAAMLVLDPGAPAPLSGVGARAPAGILYLSPASDSPELWRASVPGEPGAPEQLTQTGGRVFDYSVAPDGSRIMYSQINEQSGIDLWLMDGAGADRQLFVLCDQDRCTGSDWSPDGNRVAYSREAVGAGANPRPGPPRIWTVAVGSGQTAPLFQDSQILGHSPSWSPDGQRLAAFDGNAGGIRVLDIETGEQQVLNSQLGQVGEWSPGGQSMLYNAMRLVGEGAFTEVLLADFTTRELKPVIGPEAGYVDAGVPAWSPTDDWIVLAVRRGTDNPARELWLMRPDTSEAVSITSDPAFTYGGYSWDPAGSAVVFQRFPLATPDARPDVLVWDMGQQSVEVIAQDAWLARWLP